MRQGLLLQSLFYKRFQQIRRAKKRALADQKTLFQRLLKKGRNTLFGRRHHFSELQSVEDFQKAVPVRDYEGLSDYIGRIQAGERHVLWPGRPLYFAKTSGTTSGIKYIPVTRESIGYQVQGARNALVAYGFAKKDFSFFKGQMLFLSGSPVLQKEKGIKIGRLSGIVQHHIPFLFKIRRSPSDITNRIADWEEKLTRIVAETKTVDMTLISGIPPWIKMYFEYLRADTQRHIKDIFPRLQVMVHGGTNIKPYQPILQTLIGKEIDMIETFPASEGFIAYEDSSGEEGLLLHTDGGIFYEFVCVSEIHQLQPKRYALWEVTLGVSYVLILHTNAGLWGYNLGDTVRFVSLHPYRIIFTGRVSQFISAFGEHVIVEEVEAAMAAGADKFPEIADFTVAPYINPEGASYYEWFIEPAKEEALSEALLEEWALFLNHYLAQRNIYYKDLVQGGILSCLQIRIVRSGGFVAYMREIGQLGGQHKLPHIRNDRKVAEGLGSFLVRI